MVRDSQHMDGDELSDLFQALDHPTPDVDPGELMSRARARRVGSPHVHKMRWAAVFVLSVGFAGAAYAAPGSPVRGWIEGLVGGSVAPSTLGADPGIDPLAVPDVAGIEVAVEGRLVIEFQTQSAGELRLKLIDGTSVRAESVNGSAVFDSRSDRLLISSEEQPDYDLAIPRGAAEVEVRVGGAAVFRFAEGGVNTVARADGSERWVVTFVELAGLPR